MPAAPRVRQSKTTPLVVGDVMYLATPYNRVVALEADTGKKIWEFEAQYSASPRGIAYWPGEGQYPPSVVFGASGGRLVSINAKTGKLIPGFGNEGVVDLRPGVADHFPNGRYSMSTPPAIYKNLAITGAQLQEEPAKVRLAMCAPGICEPGSWSGHSILFRGPARRTTMCGREISGWISPAPTSGAS